MLRSLLRSPPTPPQNRFPHVHLPRKLSFLPRFRRTHIPLSRDILEEQRQRSHQRYTATNLRSMSSGEIVELRSYGTLQGYAFVDQRKSARRLTAFDFLAPGELATHRIGEDFWFKRVARAIQRRESHPMLGSSSPSSGSCAMRLFNGSADGIPHVFVDRMGPSSIWVGCKSDAVVKSGALPSVIRFIEQQLKPVELLVTLKNVFVDDGDVDKNNSKADGQQDEEEVSLLLSEAPVGSALLPRDATTSEIGSPNSIIPRTSGSRLAFDLRARTVRRFLRELCVAKAVALVECDIATALAVSNAPASSLIFCHSSSSQVRTATTWLAEKQHMLNEQHQRKRQGSRGKNEKNSVPHIVPVDVADIEPQSVSKMLSTPSPFRVIVLQVHNDSDEEIARSTLRLQRLVPLADSRECIVVLLAPFNDAWWRGDDDEDRAVGFSTLQRVISSFGAHHHRHGQQLRVVKVFDDAMPDFPVCGGNRWASDVIAVACALSVAF